MRTDAIIFGFLSRTAWTWIVCIHVEVCWLRRRGNCNS